MTAYYYRGYYARRRENSSTSISPVLLSLLLMVVVLSGVYMIKHEVLSAQAGSIEASGEGSGGLVVSNAKLVGGTLTLTVTNKLSGKVTPRVAYIMDDDGKVRGAVEITGVVVKPGATVTIKVSARLGLKPGVYVIEVVTREMAQGVSSLVVE